jgi:hypothetical protein
MKISNLRKKIKQEIKRQKKDQETSGEVMPKPCFILDIADLFLFFQHALLLNQISDEFPCLIREL